MMSVEKTHVEQGRVYCIMGELRPVTFERVLTQEECMALRARECRLGERYRKTVACPVNGDGYWYWAYAVMCDGSDVGRATDPSSGGPL